MGLLGRRLAAVLELLGWRFAAVLVLVAVPLPGVPAQAAPCSILAFGDSITWGAYASVPTVSAYAPIWPASAHLARPGDTTYPGDLARLMRTRVCNYGIPGELAEQGRPRFHAILDSYRPRIVVILEGVNDLASSRTNAAIMRDLTAMERDVARRHIYGVMATLVPTYYPRSSPHHYLNARTRTLSRLILRWAHRHRVALADLNEAFRHDRRGYKLTADRLHPNDVGYRLLARRVARTLHSYHIWK